jgi:D-alanyl-D-alanine carboxypeptidase
VNASGLDAEGEFSSARDLITLATALSANADFRQTVTETTAQFNGETIPNTNDLLVTYPGADGIKTGHTSNAGYCVLASATRNGRRIIVAVLGAPTDDARDEAGAALLDWAFSQGPPHG